MVHIPPEIVALILIEATQPVYGASLSPSDKATLGSCSLVCAAWTAIAQARLFGDLDLRGGRSRTLGTGMFLAFFQATPHIAGAVTTLTLRHWNTRPITAFYVCFYDPFELRKTEEIEQEVSPAVLMGLVSALPRLARLKLEASTLHGWRKDTPLPARPIRLHALELWSIYYTPFSSSGTTYFDIFACFELDELHVGHNRGPPTRTPPLEAPALSQAASARRIVRHLRVRDCEWFSLHALEHGALDRESLRSIAFVALENCSLQEAGTPLLQQHGAHLRDLTLRISSDIWLSWYTTEGERARYSRSASPSHSRTSSRYRGSVQPGRMHADQLPASRLGARRNDSRHPVG